MLLRLALERSHSIFVTIQFMASTGDENAVCAPAILKIEGKAMPRRRRFKRTLTLEARLAAGAKRLREQAHVLPPGPERERLLRQARRDETASHLTEWLTSTGLRAPT